MTTAVCRGHIRVVPTVSWVIFVLLVFLVDVRTSSGTELPQVSAPHAWNDTKQTDLQLPLRIHLEQKHVSVDFIDDVQYAVSATNSLVGFDAVQYSFELILDQQQLTRSHPLIVVGVQFGNEQITSLHIITRAILKATILGLTGKNHSESKSSYRGKSIRARGNTLAFSVPPKPQCSVGVYSIDEKIGHIRTEIADYLTRAEYRQCLFYSFVYAVGFDIRRMSISQSAMAQIFARRSPPGANELAEIFSPGFLQEVNRIASTYATN